jgi:hypothetical protein
MLDNQITLNDGTDDHVYDLVSREGMTSVRRELSTDSADAHALIIKNTIDMSNPSSKNRHLVQFTWNEVSAEGVTYPASVHIVIARHKLVTDAEISVKVAQLAAFLGVTANIDAILIGGN